VVALSDQQIPEDRICQPGDPIQILKLLGKAPLVYRCRP
jgi:hypothetical protein